MGAEILPALFKILRFQIGLPVGVILAAGLWVSFDKNSAVRRAVDAQASKFVSLVAHEQLAEIERRRQVVVDALKTFQSKAHEADARALDYERQIEDYQNATDIHPSCVVGPALFDRLQ